MKKVVFTNQACKRLKIRYEIYFVSFTNFSFRLTNFNLYFLKKIWNKNIVVICCINKEIFSVN